MPPAPYPNFRWFFRTVRVLPVVAVAALAGGIIGGFSVFAIDLALTAPPNHNIPAEPGSKLARETVNDNASASPAPMRTFDDAAPTVAAAVPTAAPPIVSNANMPAVSEPAPVSAHDVSPTQPVAAAMTATQSDPTSAAITVVHPQTTLSAEQSQGQSPATIAAAPQPATVQAAQQPDTKAHTAKRRVATTHTRTLNERADETTSGNARPLYDDYSRPEDYSRQASRAGSADRAEHRSAKPRYSARRQPPDIERYSERADGRLYDRADERGDDDDGDTLPAQPPPPPPPLPFFGLFGGN